MSSSSSSSSSPLNSGQRPVDRTTTDITTDDTDINITACKSESQNSSVQPRIQIPLATATTKKTQKETTTKAKQKEPINLHPAPFTAHRPLLTSIYLPAKENIVTSTSTSRRTRGFSKSAPTQSLLEHVAKSRNIRKYNRRPKGDSFSMTFLKVGTTLLLVGVIFYFSSLYYGFTRAYSYKQSTDNDIAAVKYRERFIVKPDQQPHGLSRQVEDEGQEEMIPVFELGDASETDAFNIASYFLSKDIVIRSRTFRSGNQFILVAKKLRTKFVERYGSENAARAMLEKGISVFNDNRLTRLIHVADRIRDVRYDSLKNGKQDTFRMAFGGNSATAGYGNYFNQSFPFLVEEHLREPFRLLGLNLIVTNAAMDGISTFPMGWCMENFFGQADVISWDFGAVPSETVEAFIRQAITLEKQPMIIFRDSTAKNKRHEIIESYVKAGVLADPIIVHSDNAIDPFLSMKKKHLPDGLQNWNDFGAPKEAHGLGRKNLSLKQHELLAWIIAMDILSALEVLVAGLLGTDYSNLSIRTIHTEREEIPPPLDLEESAWKSLLFGSPVTSLQCRTSFEPTLSGGLEELVVSGTVGNEIDLLLPKGPMYYHKGWIMDLDKTEKRQKIRMQQWEDLGFIDVKKAYYGVSASGPLRFFLPFVGESIVAAQNSGKHRQRRLLLREQTRILNGIQEDTIPEDSVEEDHLGAKMLFHSIIVCEANTPRDDAGCDLHSDVTFILGGKKVSQVETIDTDIVSYLGKRLCVILSVPNEADLQTREEMALDDKNKHPERITLGLSLEIEVTSTAVTWSKGPCSVAHVLWQQMVNSDP